MKGLHRATLNDDFVEVVGYLASDLPLPVRYRNHALTGEWKDFRDCHIKPDLVLIYRKPDQTRLQLVRIGAHGAPYGALKTNHP